MSLQLEVAQLHCHGLRRKYFHYRIFTMLAKVGGRIRMVFVSDIMLHWVYIPASISSGSGFPVVCGLQRYENIVTEKGLHYIFYFKVNISEYFTNSIHLQLQIIIKW